MACLPQPPDRGPGVDPCEFRTLKAGESAGYPFSVAEYRATVAPKLSGCEIGMACHGTGSPASRMQVFSQANPGNNCFEEETFNQVVARLALSQDPAMSPLVTKISDAADSHPDNADLATALQTFVSRAKIVQDGGTPPPLVDGGPGGDGGGGNPGAFDPDVFASDIQEIFDDGGCLATCHNTTNAFAGFGLTPMAFPGSPEIQANFEVVVSKIQTSLTPDQATMATVYVKATTAHGGSNPITNTVDLTTLQNWIADGLGAQ